MSDDPKLSKLAPLRLSEETNLRVVAAAKRRGVKRPEWIRQAIMAELERDEAMASRGIMTAEQRALIELCESAQKRGVDPRKALADALEATLTADVATPAA